MNLNFSWQKQKNPYNKKGMTTISKGLFYLIIAITPLALAEEAAAKVIVCKNNKIVRTIRVIEVNDENKENKCVTMYSKGGTDKIVGGGKSSVTCTGVASNIRANLEKARWQCKAIVPAGIESHDKFE